LNKAVIVSDNTFISRILTQYPQVIVLCDTNSEKLCLPLLNINKAIKVIRIQSGEYNKSAFSLNYIWNKLFEENANRETVLINLGGGIITDIGGLAAATYNRGIRFIHIPTTLMGMVDAANGGKTGINFNGVKNYIGTFTEPESIFIWPKFIETLPFIQIQSGFAEMLKHGLIANKTYWEMLSSIQLSQEIDWLPLIKASVDIKHGIVSDDFNEKGKRKILNFGHTIGHALESHLSGLDLPHGCFVAAGMVCETFLSHIVGKLDLAESQKIIFTIDSFFPRISFDQNNLELITHLILKDKKNKKAKINAILLKKIGMAEFDREITQDEIKECLSFYIS
jgi:3-dehydroquinate synthase